MGVHVNQIKGILIKATIFSTITSTAWYRLVDQHVPCSGGDGGEDGGLDQDALDLVNVHPPHHGLGYGGDSGHGSGLWLYSLVGVNQAILAWSLALDLVD